MILNESANISNIIITPTSSTVGEITDYLFEVFPSSKIVTGDVFIVVFPPSIVLLSSISVVNKDNMSLGLIFEKINMFDGTTTFKLTLNFTLGSITSGKFSFSIQGIKNPTSMKTTNTLFFKIVTSDNFEIEKYNTIKSLTMKTPGILTNTIIKALIDQIGVTSDYTFQLLPSNIIPKNGFILVKYPTQVQFIFNFRYL